MLTLCKIQMHREYYLVHKDLDHIPRIPSDYDRSERLDDAPIWSETFHA